MKKSLLLTIIIACLTSCAKKEDPFLIQKDQIGKLSKEITVQQLDSIFANDSLVKRIGEGDFVQAGDDKYLIYEKGGKQLLTLTPRQQHDVKEKIKTIQVHDPRFKTAKGLTLKSTFKDIREHYKIRNIHNTFRNLVITVDGNEYFTIDKKQLPEDLRYDINLNIEALQIPDAAKIKYFMINWEHTEAAKNDSKDEL
ncbi:hypothetical protein H2O64_14630 [Kordia sp. YSTF-M3]|uniref:Lipoprotein n=1 Tax=Kordia aestuariivivens TaxID=2759037 RepID=A0ABR7QBG0_9FLAO|nr:hypothetical protein [Kordia aestuariivivens]MBC8755911.1 hypothetical protein [Kordia aestuariivivens]